MPRQRKLPLRSGEDVEELWNQFPPRSRREVIELYARVIARAADMTLTRGAHGETEDEPSSDGFAKQDSP